MKDLDRFADESLDLREFNSGSGVSLAQLFSFLEHNRKAIEAAFDDDFAAKLIEELQDRGKIHRNQKRKFERFTCCYVSKTFTRTDGALF